MSLYRLPSVSGARGLRVSAKIVISLHLVCGPAIVSGAAKPPLTVVEAIETARIMNSATWQGSLLGGESQPVSRSPNGDRYAIRVVRGDAKRNGVWLDLYSGQMDSVATFSKPKLVARLFSSGKGSGSGITGSESDVIDAANELRWIGNHRVAFLWTAQGGVRQVVLIDLDSQQVRYVTNSATAVRAFGIAPDGTVLYAAEAIHPRDRSQQLLKSGFAVPRNADIIGLLRGDVDGYTNIDRFWNCEWFITSQDGRPARKIRVGGHEFDLYPNHWISMSPDGHTAIVNSAPTQIPQDWIRYDGMNGLIRAYIQEGLRSRSSVSGRFVQQLFVVDLSSGVSRPLWPAFAAYAGHVPWSPDGRSVLLAPTFLPPSTSDASGLEGRAVAEVEVSTGAYHVLPIEVGESGVSEVEWIDNETVRLDLIESGRISRSRVFQRKNGSWVALSRVSQELGMRTNVRFEIQENLHTPPKLYAIEAERRRLVLDPNPHLQESFAFSRVELISGRTRDADWSGLLYYPLHYKDGRRYPLVIQSDDGRPPRDKFTIYGSGWMPGLGPSLVAVYPGQLLANREMFVLHLYAHTEKGTPREAEEFMHAYEAAIHTLVGRGLIEGSKVGLVGFSRTGWKVEYTLSHSDLHFAAAIAADNLEPSYFAGVLADWDIELQRVNGGAPFGEGIKPWLERAPGFNAQRITTPLQLISQSNSLWGLLDPWELFANLRYLNKPVELYVIPDIAHGTHNTQNPAQIAGAQQSAIDWFDFWLNGYEDPDSSKAAQYGRWRELREKRDGDSNGTSTQ